MRYATKFLKIACLAVWTAGAALADEAPQADPCQSAACRIGGRIAVMKWKEGDFGVEIGRSPYIQPDGSILIYPGETLMFRAEVEGDKIASIRFVAAYAAELPVGYIERDGDGVKDVPGPDLPMLPDTSDPRERLASFPPGTILVSFGQFADRDDMPGVVMTTQHNLPKMLKLDAFMAVPKRDGLEDHPTSTCPIMPKVRSIEHWPHPIAFIVLKNLRFLPDGADMVCD